MATIDELNFEVILKDDKFNAKINQVMATAQKFNTSLSSALMVVNRFGIDGANAVKKLDAALKDVSKSQEKVNDGFKKINIGKIDSAKGKLGGVKTELTSIRSLMHSISMLTGVTFGLAGIRRFVSSMIEITGQFEIQRVALRVMLQDAEAAQRIYQDLYEFSSRSTYRFSELAKYAKQLAAFNIGKDSLLETTKMLGDVASGVGVSMDRIILAYGHVKSSGFLRGIQLRSFSQNGVPILEELAKMFTEVEGRAVSLGDVFDKMMKREISFEMVEEAFRRMTSEGGQFYHMQEEIAQTLLGQINILKGRWENLMNEMGQTTDGIVMWIVKDISEAISSLDNFKASLEKIWNTGSPLWLLISQSNKMYKNWFRPEIMGKKEFEYSMGGGKGGGSRGENEGTSQEYYDLASIAAGIQRYDRDIAKLRKKAESSVLNESDYKLLKAMVEDREIQAKLYKEISGVEYGKTTNGSGGGGKSTTQKTIEAEIKLFQKYKDARDKLIPLVGEDNVGSLLGVLFGVDFEDTDFEGKIISLADALSKFGEDAANSAEQIKAALGKDAVDEYYKSAQALKKINDEIEEYLSEDFGLSGGGASMKISNAVKELYKKNRKVDKEVEKRVKGINEGKTAYISDFIANAGKSNLPKWMTPEAIKAAAEAYWENYRQGMVKAINEQAENEKAANKEVADEKIKDQAKAIFEEATKGLDLSKLSKKSIDELETLKKALGAVDVPKELREKLDSGTLEKLIAALKEIANGKIGEISNEEADIREKKAKKNASTIKELASAVSQLGTSLKEYADASGNQTLAVLGEELSLIGEVASSVVSRFAEGDIIGGIVSGISLVVKEVLSAFTETAKLNSAIAETTEKARALSYKSGLSNSVSSIFGTNQIQKVKNAITNIEKLQSLLSSDKGKVNISRKIGMFQGNAPGDKIGTRSMNLEKTMKELGYDLLDGYGNLNAEGLQAILDTYDKLTKEDKEWITQAINNSKAYEEAVKQVNDVVSSVFGNMASSAADKIVDGWINAGNAALDYASILDDVAKKYAKMMIESAILDTVLDEKKAKDVVAKFMNGDTEGAMAEIAASMEQIAGMSGVFTQILEAFDPYFNRTGTESDSLKSGISKALVEQNSTLLASYLNAIRADVSVMRGLQTSGWQDVRLIREAMQDRVAPSYQEYMAQIMADTHEMSLRQQLMLEKVSRIAGAVMASSNGGTAIRTSK